MNYSENYLKGANMLDSEMEQFDRNPGDFVEAMGWIKTLQKEAETVRGKLELVKKDYLSLEKIIDKANGDTEVDSIQDFITNLFAKKINKAIQYRIKNLLLLCKNI